jgi:hypothetical protein
VNIVEILCPNLSAEQKPYRLDNRFVAYVPGGTVGDPEPYADAVRTAIALGPQGCVGFVVTPEPAPVAIDYSQPLPGILSRKGKRKAQSNLFSVPIEPAVNPE